MAARHTPETRAKVLALLKQGLSIKDIARSGLIDRTTVIAWRDQAEKGDKADKGQ